MHREQGSSGGAPTNRYSRQILSSSQEPAKICDVEGTSYTHSDAIHPGFLGGMPVTASAKEGRLSSAQFGSSAT